MPPAQILPPILALSIAALPALAAGNEGPIPYWKRADVQEWIKQTVQQHDLSEEHIQRIVKTARYRADVIGYAKRPAESMSWHRYRKIFLTPERTASGRAYLEKHADLFAAAERDYSVSAEIIAGIIGVETYYGENTGQHRVLDALMTLGFDYPPRAKFFRGQIVHLLLLEREAGLRAQDLYGSWAGAMGLGQFIPSSYRHFAVDGDGDGKRDLWNSPADIIASVANYFKQHHWKMGNPIAERLNVANPDILPISKALLPDITVEQIEAAGLTLSYPDHSPVAVHKLEAESGTEYWVGYHNFYVITRYNHSALYALAVYQLSQTLHHDVD